MFLIPTVRKLSEVKRIAKTAGFSDVKVSRDKKGMWIASAKRNGLAMWYESHGVTRRNALNNLLFAIRRLEGLR